MNLLECLEEYHVLLRDYGLERAEQFLNDVVDEKLHKHIRECFYHADVCRGCPLRFVRGNVVGRFVFEPD